jgi:hypothetical protein
VSRPGFALAGGQAHSIERRGNMFVRPPAGHAAHDVPPIAKVWPGCRRERASGSR